MAYSNSNMKSNGNTQVPTPSIGGNTFDLLFADMHQESHSSSKHDISDTLAGLSIGIQPDESFFHDTNPDIQQKEGLTLDSFLATRNLQRCDAGGGGDCFYHAIAHQIYGRPNMYMTVRQRVVKWMREHQDEILPFFPSIKSFNQFLKMTGKAGTWVDGQMEIRAAAHVFRWCCT